MTHPSTLSAEDLSDKLAEFLVNGPLYKRLVYYSKDAHTISPSSGNPDRYARLPSPLKMYCANRTCTQETLWEPSSSIVYIRRNPFHEIRYVCRNCGRNAVTYWLLWTEDRDYLSTLLKCGQYPALSIEPSPALAKALGEKDAELYKKALINGNSAFGIGALAYFRRVIENKVNMLLDLISEAAHLAKFEEEELGRLEEIKNSHHVDVKIEYASKILPPHLRPGGHNPLNKLYAVASAGIHNKSDEECLDDFLNARFEFEYLFKNLTVSNEEAREYLTRVSGKNT